MSTMTSDSLGVIRLWEIVTRYWKVSAAIILVCVIAALVLAFVLTPSYRSSVLLAPSRHTDSEGMFGNLQGGALGLLKGLQTPQQTVTSEAVAILQSRAFLERFIDKHQLLPVLFEERWNAQAGAWSGKQPALEDGYLRFFKSVLKVRMDDETGFVKVFVTAGTPQLSAQWANQLVDELNNEIRERVVSEGNADLKYLNDRMIETQVPEIRASIANLVRDRTKEVMLAINREGYAFRVLERAVPSKYRYHPQRVLILIGGFIVGVLLSIATIAVMDAWRIRKLP